MPENILKRETFYRRHHLSSLTLLERLKISAKEAGNALLACRFAGALNVRQKTDGSPVTVADCASEDIILEALHAVAPDVFVLSEEDYAHSTHNEAFKKRLHTALEKGTFFCVDPLDGTYGFVQGNDEFVVSIGLIDKGQPLMGVIYAPCQRRLFWGYWDEDGLAHAAQEYTDHEEHVHTSSLRVQGNGQFFRIALSSRKKDAARRFEMLDAGGREKRFLYMGSALKFGLLAAGEIDLYVRYGRTMEWDTAAGEAIVACAGGVVRDMRGGRLAYGKLERAFANTDFFAGGVIEVHDTFLSQLEMDGKRAT